jgi:internalin A
MRKIILLLILNITFLLSKDSFINLCKNPTTSQIVTLKAMANKVNKYREEKNKIYYEDKNFCEVLNKKFSILTYLPSANIVDISVLKYFPDTPTLNLWNNKITDITPLK